MNVFNLKIVIQNLKANFSFCLRKRFFVADFFFGFKMRIFPANFFFWPRKRIFAGNFCNGLKKIIFNTKNTKKYTNIKEFCHCIIQ